MESRTQDESTIRTFLAVELPDSLRNRLAAVQGDFSRYASLLKWSAPSLLHITLRFLGGVPQDRMELVMDASNEAAEGSRPFDLTVTGLGAFPNSRQPRVIWVGLERDAGYEALTGLFEDLDAALTARGFPREERAFSPHITLARTRDRISVGERRELGTALAAAMQKTHFDERFRVTGLTVMRSDLGSGGPRYTPMARYTLGAPAASGRNE